jgi:hypothetical protein
MYSIYGIYIKGEEELLWGGISSYRGAMATMFRWYNVARHDNFQDGIIYFEVRDKDGKMICYIGTKPKMEKV